MIELKDNYQDDVLDSEKNQLRKYNMIHNDDGTVSFVDATVYSQNGDNFGAKDVNDIVARIGEVSKAENIAYDGEKSVQGAIDEVVRTLGYTKSYNLIPYPHYSTTFSQNGIDWTDNGDGTVTANGTATAETTYFVKYRTVNPLPINEGEYILSGCPRGGSSSGYNVFIGNTVDSALNVLATDYGESVEFTTEDTEIGIFCKINSGVTVNNIVFKPMISKEGGEYKPYVEDVQTQIDKIFDISGTHQIVGILSKSNRGQYCIAEKVPFHVNPSLYNIQLDFIVCEKDSSTVTLSKQAAWIDMGYINASTTQSGYEGCMARAQVTITKK